MSPPNLTTPPATAPSPDEIPDFAELAADPEIAPLLVFEPVVRKIKRPDGWFPELQRELIARIAATGTIQAAVWQMGKHATGAEALYKVPTADSFRASWDAAVAIGRRRNGLDSQPPYTGEVPGITRRSSSGGASERAMPGAWPRRGASMTTAHLDDADADAEESEELREEKLKVMESLFTKWLGKVEAERKARLEGDVVAADFYLRQLTFFEICFDLRSEGLGEDAFTLLSEFRRGGFHVVQIAATPFTQLLDAKRRELWAKLDEPDRPEFPPARYLVAKDGFFIQSNQAALSKAQKKLPTSAQEKLFRARMAEEAVAQAEWERRAQSVRGD